MKHSAVKLVLLCVHLKQGCAVDVVVYGSYILALKLVYVVDLKNLKVHFLKKIFDKV